MATQPRYTRQPQVNSAMADCSLTSMAAFRGLPSPNANKFMPRGDGFATGFTVLRLEPYRNRPYEPAFRDTSVVNCPTFFRSYDLVPW